MATKQKPKRAKNQAAADARKEEAEVKRIIEERKGVPTIPWRDWFEKYC
jgi:hypothetical protein